MESSIVLRYFAARGRAQFLRNYLACRAAHFDDERVAVTPTFEAWTAMRLDESRSGPFHRLPVLHWGERLIPEALVIRQFLHDELGDAAQLSRERNVAHAALVSSLYTDVLTPIGVLFWADLVFPGVDVSQVAKRSLTRLQDLFGAIDVWLAGLDWHAEARVRPIMLADCFLWDQLDVVQLVFGELLGLARFDNLQRVYAESAGREVFARLRDSLALPVTGRGLAAEQALIPKFREAAAA